MELLRGVLGLLQMLGRATVDWVVIRCCSPTWVRSRLEKRLGRLQRIKTARPELRAWELLETYQMLAASYEAEGKNEEAYTVVERQARDPLLASRSAEAYLAAAYRFINAGRLHDVEDYLEKARRSLPEDSFWRAEAIADLGRLEAELERRLALPQDGRS
jgi:tetratricopeptide (TPR) repeat protein